MNTQSATAKTPRWILPMWMRMMLFATSVVPLCVLAALRGSILLIAFIPVYSIALLSVVDRIYRSKRNGQFED